MKIKIANLGPIKDEISINLKPMTIFVGPNNSGKTWTAFAIASIFGPRAVHEYHNEYFDNSIKDDYPSLDKAFSELMEKGSTKIDLIKFFDDYGEYYINNLAKFEVQWFQDFMGSTEFPFKSMRLRIELMDEQKDKIIKKIKSYLLRGAFSPTKDGEALLNVVKEKDNQFLSVYTSIMSDDGKSIQELENQLTPNIIKSILFDRVFRIISRSIYRDVYFFPAERAALGLIERLFTSGKKLESKDDKKTIKAENINASEENLIKPVIIPDSIGNLIGILEFSKSSPKSMKRRRASKKKDTIKECTKLSNLLQDEILKGRLHYSDEKQRDELLFKPSNETKISLDMPIVSSMIKELSPLVLYLRDWADSGDLIIIDEPEMNLHPEAQAKMIELLTMLVNAGVNVLATTHSPYIIDHLINLMNAADHLDPKGIEDKFYLKSSKAFISKDNVSVYLFDNDTAKDILDKEGFIEWETFNDVSQRILDLRMEL